MPLSYTFTLAVLIILVKLGATIKALKSTTALLHTAKEQVLVDTVASNGLYATEKLLLPGQRLVVSNGLYNNDEGIWSDNRILIGVLPVFVYVNL